MEKPDWIKNENIKTTLDARPLLVSGVHPFDKVIEEASKLNSGEIYEVLTPFPPLPMIQKLEALGFISYSEQDDEGLFHTYFQKQ